MVMPYCGTDYPKMDIDIIMAVMRAVGSEANIIPEDLNGDGQEDYSEELAYHSNTTFTKQTLQEAHCAQAEEHDDQVDEDADQDIVGMVRSLERHDRSERARAGYEREGNGYNVAAAAAAIAPEEFVTHYHFESYKKDDDCTGNSEGADVEPYDVEQGLAGKEEQEYEKARYQSSKARMDAAHLLL